MNKPKFLVVDDDPISLEVSRERLLSAGYEVVVRERALGTSQAILVERPDYVLLDIIMPGLSGNELAMLLSERTARGARIIFHSSKDVEQLREITRQTGALGAIQKTSDDEQFLRELERIVNR